MRFRPGIFFWILQVLTVTAGESTHYSLSPAAVDHGGAKATSAHYSADLSAAPGNAGSSSNYTARSGYAGQLLDVFALVLDSSEATVDEGGTRQLTAQILFDDATTMPLAVAEVSWSVSSGPLSMIDLNGLVTAGLVYEDTIAVAQGDYATFSDTLNLTVLDIDLDNFGSYAGDGLPDDWQVLYFGEENPNAGPLNDPDLDGQNNQFEFIAGIIPTDPQSIFSWKVSPNPGQPGESKIVFDPIVSGRVYTLQTSSILALGSWVPLTGTTTTDDGDERTVVDPNANSTRKFYRLKIEKP